MIPPKTTVKSHFIAQVLPTHSWLPLKGHPVTWHEAVGGWACGYVHPDTQHLLSFIATGI